MGRHPYDGGSPSRNQTYFSHVYRSPVRDLLTPTVSRDPDPSETCQRSREYPLYTRRRTTVNPSPTTVVTTTDFFPPFIHFVPNLRVTRETVGVGPFVSACCRGYAARGLKRSSRSCNRSFQSRRCAFFLRACKSGLCLSSIHESPSRPRPLCPVSTSTSSLSSRSVLTVSSRDFGG